MFFKKDERVQTAKRIAIRYTYCFQLLLIVALSITSTMYKGLILLPPVNLFNSSIYFSLSLNSNISIISSTQILVLLLTQVIFNKDLGGTSQPLLSGTSKFRPMDERERTVSDKALFATFIYTNILLIIWTIIDVLINNKLGFSIIIITLQFIFYSIAKGILLHHYGEDLS